MAADRPGDAQVAAALARLQHDDARLQTVGWQLATANAAYCRDAAPAIGLLLLDARQFDRPRAVRSVLGMAGDIAVEAVAEGSPAAMAGLLPGEEIVAIDGQSTAIAAAPASQADEWQDRIGRKLAQGGKITLGLRDASGTVRQVMLAGKAACQVPFALETGSDRAEADGARVIVGQGFGTSGSPAEQLDESEFAAAVAHEMAHDLLNHPARLARAGRSTDTIRQTEREADRLAVWLLSNAGYDPASGPRLMRGWARRRDPGLARLPTHDSWDQRAELMEREIVRLRTVLRETGQADWARDFIRQPTP